MNEVTLYLCKQLSSYLTEIPIAGTLESSNQGVMLALALITITVRDPLQTLIPIPSSLRN